MGAEMTVKKIIEIFCLVGEGLRTIIQLLRTLIYVIFPEFGHIS